MLSGRHQAKGQRFSQQFKAAALPADVRRVSLPPASGPPDWLLRGLAREVGWISKHGETLVTEALTLLLRRPGLEAAFRDLLATRCGAYLPGLRWEAEHHLPGHVRPDVAGFGERGGLAAVVEAKLGARLTVEQLLEYAWHLGHAEQARGSAHAVLVVLVPAFRGPEADAILRAGFWRAAREAYHLPLGIGNVTVVRLTWDQVGAALRGADVSAATVQDVEQFISLVRALEGREIEPFTTDDLAAGWERRHKHYIRVVEQTTSLLSHLPRLQPMGRDASLGDRRYVTPEPQGPELAVGLRDPAQTGVRTPFWLRYDARTARADTVRTALSQSEFADELSHDHGHIWLPLFPLTGVGAVAVVDDLAEQILVRDEVARGAATLREVAAARLPLQRTAGEPVEVEGGWDWDSINPHMLLHQVSRGLTRADLFSRFPVQQSNIDRLLEAGLLATRDEDYRLTAAGADFLANSHDYDSGGDIDDEMQAD